MPRSPANLFDHNRRDRLSINAMRAPCVPRTAAHRSGADSTSTGRLPPGSERESARNASEKRRFVVSPLQQAEPGALATGHLVVGALLRKFVGPESHEPCAVP